MFDPSIILERVSPFRWQKNRLKLAKVLANPKSCLILDEPTNDLDMETLDMLGEILISYKGTLLLVSHDRDFLDQTVTKILSFEGDGVVEETIGGYSDYLSFKNSKLTQNSKNKNEEKNSKFKVIAKSGENKNNKKLTYKLEFELNSLPSKIKNLENDINDFNAKLSDPNLYLNEPDIFFEITKKLEKSKEDLEYFENRWLELEEIKNF